MTDPQTTDREKLLNSIFSLSRQVAEWHLGDGDDCGATARKLTELLDRSIGLAGEFPDHEQYTRAGKNAELIAWLTQLRDTKKFPIGNRPTDWFIDRIFEELK